MSEPISLEGIERKAWLTVFSDGLIDLGLGCLLMWWGVIYLLAKSDLSTPVMTTINMSGYLLIVVSLLLAKRFVTAPRIGRARFSKKRLFRVAWAGVVAAVLVNTTFALTVVAIARQKSLLGDNLSPFMAPALLGAFFLMLFGVPAFILDYRRLLVVAVMFALPEIVRTAFREFWAIDPGATIFRVAAGAVVVVMGVTVLVRFLRANPVVEIPEEETIHDGTT